MHAAKSMVALTQILNDSPAGVDTDPDEILRPPPTTGTRLPGPGSGRT
jgi:hypothetical protein